MRPTQPARKDEGDVELRIRVLLAEGFVVHVEPESTAGSGVLLSMRPARGGLVGFDYSKKYIFRRQQQLRFFVLAVAAGRCGFQR